MKKHGERDGQNVQQIWTEYGNLLRGFLAKRVACPEDVDDLLQDILLKTHKYLKTHREPEKMQAWLFQVARNTLTDHYRSRSTFTTNLEPSEFEEIPEEISDSQIKVLTELSQCLYPFLQKLPEKYREAVEAADLKGMSQKNLAQALGVSHSTMKSRVQRGRHMLGELYQACCSYEVDTRGNITDFEEKSGCCS